MIEEQLGLNFDKPRQANEEKELVLNGKYKPEFLDAFKMFLATTLKASPDKNLSELLTEFKKTKEIGVYDVVLIAANYYEIAGVGDKKGDRPVAMSFVKRQLTELVRELDIPVFEKAFPKYIQPQDDLPEEPPEEIYKDKKTLNQFGPGSLGISKKHNEPEERDR